MAVTKYTKLGNNSAITVHVLSAQEMRRLGFRFQANTSSYALHRQLSHFSDYEFFFEIYSDGEWIIRVYDKFGATSRYKDILRDLIDSTVDEYKEAMAIEQDVHSIMKSLLKSGVIEGYVKGQII